MARSDTDTRRVKPTEPAVGGDPGYGLGIAGFIVSFFFGLVGLILSAIALKQARAAGKKHSLAFAGLIIGIVRTALDVLMIVGFALLFIFAVNECTAHKSSCTESSSSSSDGSHFFSPKTDSDPTF